VDVVEFQQGDALLVVDVLDDFDHEDGQSLLASFRERGQTMAAAIASARQAGVPVIYVNDDRDRWDGDAPALVREAASGQGGDVIGQLSPQPGDSVLIKHRYSAFDHTALELLLETKRVDRVLVAGAATEGCVVQTALDARENGLKATILVDACATANADLEELALRYAEEVGGIHLQLAADRRTATSRDHR
jgi:nicotinamidase-related amidase